MSLEPSSGPQRWGQDAVERSGDEMRREGMKEDDRRGIECRPTPSLGASIYTRSHIRSETGAKNGARAQVTRE